MHKQGLPVAGAIYVNGVYQPDPSSSHGGGVGCYATVSSPDNDCVLPGDIAFVTEPDNENPSATTASIPFGVSTAGFREDYRFVPIGVVGAPLPFEDPSEKGTPSGLAVSGMKTMSVRGTVTAGETLYAVPFTVTERGQSQFSGASDPFNRPGSQRKLHLVGRAGMHKSPFAKRARRSMGSDMKQALATLIFKIASPSILHPRCTLEDCVDAVTVFRDSPDIANDTALVDLILHSTKVDWPVFGRALYDSDAGDDEFKRVPVFIRPQRP
jgi:hypothetical protein